MKNQINNITKGSMLLGLTSVIALCMGQSSAFGKPSHGGGSGGGSFYPTASTVSQLIADINYANNTGGAVTINLAPGTTFDLTSANNSTDGGNGLPVVGGTTSVNLTIIGNGDTIERIAELTRFGTVKNPFGLFDVAAGSALTLDQVTLKGGLEGAILNHGTLNVDGATFSGNGYAIENEGGTAVISDSAVSDSGSVGIYNPGGSLTVSNVSLSGNETDIENDNGTVTISDSTLSGDATIGYGAGIYNNAGTVAISTSILSDNSARYGGAIYNNAGTVTVSYSILSGNSAYQSDYPWTLGDGGAIYNYGGNLTISNSTISGNSADKYFGSGGGIYNGGTATVEDNSSITGNTAGDAGGDVENDGVLYLDSTSTIGNLGGNPANPI